MDVAARQLWRQRCAFRLLALRFNSCRLKLFELHLDSNQIAIDGLVEQVHLLTVELFAAPAELLALEDRDLVGELVDTGLPVVEFPVSLTRFPLLLLDLDNQLSGKGAQLFRVEGVEVGGVHAGQSARTLQTGEARLFTSPPDSDDSDHAILADALPRQAQHQTGQLFVRQGTLLGFAADGRPSKLPLIQASRGQPDADPVVNQNLHAVGAPIGEQIRMVWVRGAEHLDHTRQGRVETSTHVQWVDRQPDLVDTDHRSHSRSQAAHWVASDTGQLTVID